jgi:protease II
LQSSRTTAKHKTTVLAEGQNRFAKKYRSMPMEKRQQIYRSRKMAVEEQIKPK